MSRENAKTSFTKEEHDKMQDLVAQLEKVPDSSSNEAHNLRNKLRKKYGLYWSEIPGSPAYTVENFKYLFANGTLKICDAETSPVMAPVVQEKEENKPNHDGRKDSDEYYVIDLCDEVLGKKAERQKTFDFLKGDKGHKLPVDAYYPDLKLAIEYHERQHSEEVAFFDRRMTVSGVSRGEQRKIYDARRAEVLPQHGIELIVISFSDFGTKKKLERKRLRDIEIVREKLKAFVNI